ncbi:MAG: tetratricopeptide repeat protein [Saprospiraceae bacterium]
MSKKSQKRTRPAKPSPKKAPVPGFPSLLDRPSVATEKDAFHKKIFLGLGAGVLLLTIVLALGSGINGDDEYQNDYSAKLVNYYSTMGADTAALNIPKGSMHYYGGFFDIVTGFTNKALGYEVVDAGYHHVRHFYNAIFGFLAMLFTALLAKEIAGWRAGILTLLFMFLSPRFLGHSLMNPKDIPFAAGYVMALYYMVLLCRKMPKPHWKTALGVAGGIALAIATRAGGMLLIAYLGLFAGLDFLVKNGFGGIFNDGKKVARYAAYVAGISLAGFLTATLFWPWALQAPFSHPFEALGEFSKLGVKIRVLFEGENVMSDKTPWHYAIDWIWRTIPLFALAGFVGSFFVLRRILKKYAVLPVFMTLFAAVFPVAYIIYKDSILHDAWRHLIFVYPAMVVMAALFWLVLEEYFSRNGKTALYALYGVVGLMAVESTQYIVRNSHYPYTYFNILSGGIKGAFGQYETDYWGVSMKQAVDWLDHEGIIKPDMTDTVTIATSFSYVLNTYVSKKYNGKVKVLYTRFNKRYDRPFDYGIFPSRYIKGPHLRGGGWPNSRSVHAVTANGVPLTSIEKGGGPVFEGEQAYKRQDWAAASQAFQRELKDHPDNEIALLKLTMCQSNLGQFAEARATAGRVLEVTPDNANALFYRGVAALNTGDVNAAEADFYKAIKIEEGFGSVWYYLALIKRQRNDLPGALQNIQKAIEVAPRFKPAYELAAQIYEQQGDGQRAQQIRAAAAKF